MWDVRFYKLMCCQLKDPPEPGELFLTLRDLHLPKDDEEVDDAAIFQRVTAELSPFSKRK
jgi:hypothetical protein